MQSPSPQVKVKKGGRSSTQTDATMFLQHASNCKFITHYYGDFVNTVELQ